jgi:hypothetical protein
MDSELLPHAQTLLLSRQLVERDKNAKNLQLWQCRTAWMAHLDPGHDLPDMRNDTERLLGARLHMQMLSMRAWRVFERGDARHNVPPRTVHVGQIEAHYRRDWEYSDREIAHAARVGPLTKNPMDCDGCIVAVYGDVL